MDRRGWRFVAPRFNRSLVLFGLLLHVTSGLPARAGSHPEVRFDVVRLVGCREVTPPEFAANNPRNKLIRAVFEVSSLVHGDETSLIENRYQITVPHGRLQVFDYEPRTMGASQYAGNIAIERHSEKSNQAGVSMSGGWKYLAQITGNGDTTAKDTSSVRYELLPPLEAVAASGTLQRGSAVYFKLKRMRQALLEGSKQFAITFRAPRDWSADYVHLHCSATGLGNSSVWSASQTVACGEGNFLVALHLEGNEESRRTAAEFMDAAIDLGRLAARQRREIQRQAYPTILHQFGAAIGTVEPKISEDWLSEVMYLSQSERVRQVTRQLPPDVRQAAQHYLAARAALQELAAAR